MSKDFDLKKIHFFHIIPAEESKIHLIYVNISPNPLSSWWAFTAGGRGYSSGKASPLEPPEQVRRPHERPSQPFAGGRPPAR